MKPYRFIISGGGTGGHIYPAIAIANELKKQFPDAVFLFVGAKDRMEMEKIPKAGYEIKGLWISGLQRKMDLKNLSFPLKLALSLKNSRQILRSFKPDVAIGTGGYASAPLLRMASYKKIPCLVQEQNSHAGITNKWLSSKVDRICVAYTGMEAFFPKQKLKLTGNPVRQDLLDVNALRDEAVSYFNLDPTKKTVLILGGSLGARKINEFVNKTLPFFKEKDIQLIWQCGAYYANTYKAVNVEGVQVHPFLERMDLAYAASDFIISRSGALSVSELCLVGKPVVFVPSPNVAEDHQTKNANAIVQENAALLIAEKDLDTTFKSVFSELLVDVEKQNELSRNIKKLAKPNATQEIVEEVKELLKKSIHRNR